MCSSGNVTKLSLYYLIMQILEKYKAILLADELFNYKIRNRALLSGGNVEFFHLHSEAYFLQPSLEVKAASKTQENFIKVVYGCFLPGLFVHTEIKYLNHEELHIIHIVSSEL